MLRKTLLYYLGECLRPVVAMTGISLVMVTSIFELGFVLIPITIIGFMFACWFVYRCIKKLFKKNGVTWLLRSLMLFVATLTAMIFAISGAYGVFEIASYVAIGIAGAWLGFLFIQVLRTFRFQKLCEKLKEVAQAMKGFWVNFGGNRTGKSLLGFAILFYKASMLEKYVKRFTALYSVKKTRQKLPSKEYREYLEIKETNDAYKKKPHLLPCLVTNVTVTDNEDHRKSAELLGEHLLQEAKLPMPVAVGLDESSSKVDIQAFRDSEGSIILTELARWFNQFTGDGSLFVLMEQNSARSFKGYRDSIQGMRNCHGVKTLLEPKRLLRKLERLFDELDDLIDNDKLPEYSLTMKILNLHSKRINKIGVFQVHYSQYTGNKETGGADIDCKSMKSYIPRDMPFDYPNRYFATSYKARKLEIKLKEFKHDLQSEESVEDFIRIKGKKLFYRGKPVIETTGRVIEDEIA
ncbi:MAG: hypothetical protein FWE16_05655 [Firmicutes bacterium]|nr:hypothetical protein [Bacillota bacterium]